MSRMKQAGLLGALLLVGIASTALAQTVTTTPVVVVEQPSLIGMIWTQVRDVVYLGLGTLVTGLITWLATWLRDKFKIEIEAKHREALHQAIMTGLMLALKKAGIEKEGLSLMSATQKREIVDVALAHVNTSTPDALKGLNTTTTSTAVNNIANAKLEAIVLDKATTPPAAPGQGA